MLGKWTTDDDKATNYGLGWYSGDHRNEFNDSRDNFIKESNVNNRPWTTDSDNTSGDDGNKFYLIDYHNCECYVFNNRKEVESYIERNYDEEEAGALDVFYGLKRTIQTEGGNFKVSIY